MAVPIRKDCGMVIDDSKSISKPDEDIKRAIQESKLSSHTKLSLIVCLKYKLYSAREIRDYILLGNQLCSVK